MTKPKSSFTVFAEGHSITVRRREGGGDVFDATFDKPFAEGPSGFTLGASGNGYDQQTLEDAVRSTAIGIIRAFEAGDTNGDRV